MNRNKFRLIAAIHYNTQKLFVLRVLTHKEYDTDLWKMNTTDLGNLLGNKGLASPILNGKRELSKAHIRLLAERFKVSPALFI